MNKTQLQIEALLFLSGKGFSVREMSEILSVELAEVKIAIDSLVDEYLEREGGILIKEVAGVYSFVTNPESFDIIKDYLKEDRRDTLSPAVMESLAIIAYKQPITVMEIEDLRGVNSRTHVSVLLQRKLIKQMGQKEVPGRPMQYGTTSSFLKQFGLRNLEELPSPGEVRTAQLEDLD
jgi:segregation and condensation protein B